MNGILKVLKQPSKILRQILIHTPRLWPDELYLKLMYPCYIGRKLDLDNPRSFNEKLQWLKLHDHQEKYITMVDKYKVKDYVASIIGDQYIIPTLQVWDRPEDVDWDVLPNQFVLKCNHDSGGLFICKDKSALTQKDKDEAIAKLRKSFKRNFFYFGREWAYKFVEKKIIAEKYMGEALNDYKLMCFGGKVEYTFVYCDRFSGTGLRKSYYDVDWNRLPFYHHDPPTKEDIPCPQSYQDMLRIATILSADIPFVRVDLYDIEGRLYFGELTLFPASGYKEFRPEEWDYKLGDLIKLPKTV